MSYGNCVVSNGTPENLEVVGDAGVCFEKNNFGQLAEILARLLAAPEEVNGYGQRASERAHRLYSWDSVVVKYETLLAELIESRRAAYGTEHSHHA
jgi:glycosyltransferase involved in cell wall biosynthesis